MEPFDYESFDLGYDDSLFNRGERTEDEVEELDLDYYEYIQGFSAGQADVDYYNRVDFVLPFEEE